MMSTLQQFREGLSEAWDTLLEGWQKLYRHAAGAITRFTPGNQGDTDAGAIALRSTGWGVLASEVYDDDDQIVVRLEAPGMQKDDFDLHVTKDYLVVSGRKQMEQERTKGRYHIVECAYGSFERAIPLPDEVESDKASASYRRGILRVELPKSARHNRKRIRVDVD
jgi:HSP20 family protein